jgi:predicted nuclease of predicted toxin-antitoxin system
MTTAEDSTIMVRALDESRIVVSADTDFGTLLALTNASNPSVILVRKDFPDDPDEQADALIPNLPVYESELLAGCVLILDGHKARVRALPFFSFSNN